MITRDTKTSFALHRAFYEFYIIMLFFSLESEKILSIFSVKIRKRGVFILKKKDNKSGR